MNRWCCTLNVDIWNLCYILPRHCHWQFAMSNKNPAGFVVTIVGITSPDHGRSCVDHVICGSEVCKGMLLRLRRVRIFNNKEKAIAAYRFSDSLDRCRVGFLPRHCIKDAAWYNGVTVCVHEICSEDVGDIIKREKHYKMKGCAVAKIISDTNNNTSSLPAKKQKKENNNSTKELSYCLSSTRDYCIISLSHCRQLSCGLSSTITWVEKKNTYIRQLGTYVVLQYLICTTISNT